MSLKPLMTKSLSTHSPNSYQKSNQQEHYELIENTITVKENEEILIDCVVDSSKPAADIKFSLSNNAGSSKSEIPSLNNNHFASFLTLSPATPAPQPPSVVSVNTNIAKNNDQTFKTMHSIRLKPTQDDHGKVITCKAENGFSSQKWENKKLLNVLCKFK